MGTRAQPIVNGLVDQSGAYWGVASIGGCTAVAVADRVLLTAAHCFRVPPCGAVTATATFFGNGGPPGPAINASQGRRHPEAFPFDATQCGCPSCTCTCGDMYPAPPITGSLCLLWAGGATPVIPAQLEDWSHDLAVLVLDTDIPASIPRFPVLVDPGDAEEHTAYFGHEKGVEGGGIQAWGAAKQPYVVVAGFGGGSWTVPYDGGTSPGVTIGTNQWTAIGDSTTFFSGCAKQSTVKFPSLITTWGYNVDAQLGLDAGTWPPNGSIVVGQKLAATWRGDSGGPLFVGATGQAGPFFQPPTPLDAPQPGDTYSLGVQYVAGILSAADTGSGDTFAKYVPTWTASNGNFIVRSIHDTDGDHIPDWADPCPSSADNGDDDNDTIPNCLDSCPNDPANDADGDGICGDLDNCPSTATTDLTNSNLEFEAAKGAPRWGDACDPVPTPLHEPTYAKTAFSIAYQGEIAISPRAAHQSPNVAVATTSTADNTRVAVKNVETVFRYCDQHALAANGNPAVCTAGATLLFESRVRYGQKADMEAPQDLYHAIALETAQTIGKFTHITPLRDTSRFYDYDDVGSHTEAWAFAFDQHDWVTKGFFDSSFSVLKGTFWLNDRSDVGAMTIASPADQATTNVVGVHGDDLRSVVRAVDTTKRLIATAPLGSSTATGQVGGQAISDPLLVLGTSLWAAKRCVACNGDAFLSQATGIGEQEYAVVAAAGAGGPGVVAHDATVVQVPNLFGDALSARLSDPSIVWLTNVDPAREIGIDTPGGAFFTPVAIGLSHDGTTVVDRAFAALGGFVATQDLHGIDVAPNDPPLPRHGHTAVYSSSARAVFLIGGTLEGQSQPSGEIWRYDFSIENWTSLRFLDYAPSTVLAATYCYADRSLYVLDELPPTHDDKGTRRLVRVEPTAAVDVLGTWPTKHVHDRFFLRTDREGAAILLAATSSTADSGHTIVRLAPGKTSLEVEDAFVGKRALATAPFVDPRGYTMIARDGNGKPVVERVATLGALAGEKATKSDLAGLME